MQIQNENYYIGFQNNITKFKGKTTQQVLDEISSKEIKHMINNPLNIILGKLQLCESKENCDINEVILNTKILFKRINNYCLNIENPETHVGYNPFRS